MKQHFETWITDMASALAGFAQEYRINMKESPDNYPAEMLVGDFNEQFDLYLEQR